MEMPRNRLERAIATLAIGLLAVFIIPRSASFVTDLVWPRVGAFDPTVSGWITIHHVLQLAFTILVMKFLFRTDLRHWGFNLNESATSLRIFGGFALVYLGVWILLPRLQEIISGTAPSFDYPLSARNMAGVLGFQFLLSGSGEEPLFRGLVMTVLGKYWRGTYRIGDVEIPSAGIVATIFFMMAHIGFTISPFTITHFSLIQQLTALGLGLYYAVVFHRTGSLLGPIISHGYSNGILFVVRYSMALLFG